MSSSKITLSRRLSVPGIVVVLVVLTTCDGTADSGLPTETIRVGGEELTVEIASTPEARRQGLMNRSSLAPDRGMLFVFEESDYRSFWMKNTSIPLSLAYIDENGTILEIHELEPYSLEPVESRNPVPYALEVNLGTFERLGVGPGDRVLLPATL